MVWMGRWSINRNTVLMRRWCEWEDGVNEKMVLMRRWCKWEDGVNGKRA